MINGNLDEFVQKLKDGEELIYTYKAIFQWDDLFGLVIIVDDLGKAERIRRICEE